MEYTYIPTGIKREMVRSGVYIDLLGTLKDRVLALYKILKESNIVTLTKLTD